MYEEGLINENFGCDNSTESEFACAVITGESEKPEVVKDRIMSKIAVLHKEGIDKEEFERVRKAFFGAYLRGFNSVETIGNLVTRYILSGINIFSFPEVFDTIDADYVFSVFKEIYTEDNMAMSVVLPA